MDRLVDMATADIERYIGQQEHKGLLRFITCGSVDDGKSSLIGRLLYESHMLYEDQLAAVEAESKRWGTQGDRIDLALLVDGLVAEREQGITIDVAHRFFATEKRKFIIADTPGHEQYTRNMITGASTADAAVILVDARRGVLTQTRRHGYLVSLIGIRDVVLAVNKMDLVNYSESVFTKIVDQYRDFARQIGLEHVVPIPLSALNGDNVVTRSVNTPWYSGPTLLGLLETLDIEKRPGKGGAFRMPVQWVNRPNPDFRGYAGTVASGMIRAGDQIRVQPSGCTARVSGIVTANGDLPVAVAGQAITLVLQDEIDISRGDLISAADDPAEVADQFEATIVWMAEEPMLPGRTYWIRLGTQTTTVTVNEAKYSVNVSTLEHVAAKQLNLNDIGVCNLSLGQMVAFDPYALNPRTGGFILIDRLTNHTVGTGILHFALRRSHNIHRQHFKVDKLARASQKGQRPGVLWFTGLSGAGKSTIANLVEQKLHAMGKHTYLLDGDNIRHGLSRDLGFTEVDRIENIRRIAEVARLMVHAGLLVITAFISPFRAERELARSLLCEGEFVEIHVDVPLEVAEQRDPKGLYRKARRGELVNFTGIDSPYEVPEAPELRLSSARSTADEAADMVIVRLRELRLID